MKTWIKRTLIGAVGASILFGGLAAWAHRDGGAGWHRMGHGDSAQMTQRLVDRVGSRLDLDAAQKARLASMAETIRAQRTALMGDTDPRAELQSLIAGPSFDRARAGALVANKIAALQTGSPVVLTAMADFYDGLNPAQQAQLRTFMATRGEHRRGHREGHERGERDGRDRQ